VRCAVVDTGDDLANVHVLRGETTVRAEELEGSSSACRCASARGRRE
jgi:hypothetical protein